MGPFMQLLCFLLRVSYAIVVIPAPSGPYGVNTAAIALTDDSREDPFAPKPEKRSVVVSAFTPIAPQGDCRWELIPYMPNATAAIIDEEFAPYGVPKGTLEAFRLKLCYPRGTEQYQRPTHQTGIYSDQYPLVLFSPGFGNSRLLYSAIAQSVASHGYTVVTVDHPYDADVVEFPDGRLIRGTQKNVTEELIELALQTRVADMSFVLDELADPEVMHQLLPYSCPHHGLYTQRVGMYGHSLGGATAASVMANDSRISGGVNLDGTLFGEVIDEGLRNPFLLFRRDTTDTLQSWDRIWPHLNWKLWLSLKDSEHGTFEDLPLLAQLLGYDPLPAGLAALLGTIPGKRAFEIISTYIVALMDSVLECEPQALLQGPSSSYPEVEFVRS